MPKIDLAAVPERKGSSYPAPFDAPCAPRVRKALGDAGGLSDFGVNLLTLEPGAWSSQRHWHSDEDEFVWILSGEATLITDDGRRVLRAGDCAAFPKGAANGHHLVNESNAPAVCLEVGTRTETDVCDYPDIDMRYDPKAGGYVHRDGTLYPKR
ncbi:MAG: cupin domain-containing protein [Alphaproteobacteria bacterium]|nr:cupin domain-containing protein [Alphaproteobacteria bacterium]